MNIKNKVTRIKNYCLKFVRRYMYTSFVIVLSGILTILYLYNGETKFLGLIGILVASLFPALKYRLDTFYYNLKLYPKRLEIFEHLQILIKELHGDYTEQSSITKFLTSFDNRIYHEARFYFLDETVNFLDGFRNNLITLKSDQSKNDRTKIDHYFGKLITRGELEKHFPELKLSAF